MVLASKVYPIPLKFLSKEGQNSTRHFEWYLAAWLLVRDVMSSNETSGQVTWARSQSPCYPTAKDFVKHLSSLFDLNKQGACTNFALTGC